MHGFEQFGCKDITIFSYTQVISLKLEQFVHFLDKRYITKRQYFCIAFQKNAKKNTQTGCIFERRIVIEIESGKEPQRN